MRGTSTKFWRGALRVGLTLVLLALVFATAQVGAQSNSVRPRIFGIAHVGLYVNNISRSQGFYEDYLGFAAPFSLTRSDGNGIAFIKVNDRQYLELSPYETHTENSFDHFALYTDNTAQMRAFLLSRGVDVLGDVHKGNIGNPFFSVRDPEGHIIEIVQYAPDSWTGQDQGLHMPAKRISNRIGQIGLRVGAPNPTLKFYKEILGFEEIKQGNSTDGQVPSITLQVPDGRDRIELLLYRSVLAQFQSSVQERVYFERGNVSKTVADLRAQTQASSLYQNRFSSFMGQPGIASLYDPDGNLLELVEPAMLTAEVASTPVSGSH